MLNICFIYNEKTFNIRNRLDSLLNPDIKKKYKICNVQTFNNLEDFISDQLNTAEKAIYSKLLVFFSSDISIPEDIKYFQQKISSALKKINFISSCFTDQNIKSILMMPRRNFTSDILKRIFSVIKDDADSRENKQLNNIQDLFYKFFECHKTPKSRSKHKEIKYLRDAKDIYFKLGYEEHGRSETNSEHNRECVLGGHFRFGIRLDRNIHFNVSSEDSQYIPKSCKFIDCHDTPYYTEKNTSHLNIFTNDYIR